MIGASINPLEIAIILGADYKKSSHIINIHSEVESMSHSVRDGLLSNKSFYDLAKEHLNDLFHFRIIIAKWFFKNKEVIGEFKNEVNNFEGLLTDKKYYLLKENLDFSGRAFNRVIKKIFKSNNVENIDFIMESSYLNMPIDITINDIVKIYAQTSPNSKSNSLIQLIQASLFNEYSLYSSYVLVSNGLNVSQDRIDELAEFVSETAQKYGACLRMMEENKRDFPILKGENPNIAEEQFLAEQDIETLLYECLPTKANRTS